MNATNQSKNSFNGDVELVALESIHPSPENDELYGVIDVENNDLISLANDILENGIREPIQVSEDDFILSGHRRFAASQLAKLEMVPIRRLDVRRDQSSALEWKRLLRANNHQRVKSPAIRMNETLLDLDPELAYQRLLSHRRERDRVAPPRIVIIGKKRRCEISERKCEMLQAAAQVIHGLDEYWPLSVRQVHYGLLNNPPRRNKSTGKRYANDRASYQDLCNLLARARLLGLIPWEAITDKTRPVSGTRFSRDASEYVDESVYHFLRGYRRDLLQSQPDHIELVVEKLTVQGIVEPVAAKHCVPMTVGRGYCSLEPRHEIVERYRRSGKDRLILLVVSDFDPDGDEIAESLARSLRDDFSIESVEATKVLLRDDQIRDWNLPSSYMGAKKTSKNYQKFVDRYESDFVYELEAVPPDQIQEAVEEAIDAVIDIPAFNAELDQEKFDAADLEARKSRVIELFRDKSGNGADSDEQ